MPARTRLAPRTPTHRQAAAKTPPANAEGQDELFGNDSAPSAKEDVSTREARQRAEAAYNAHSIPASYYRMARKWLQAGDVTMARAYVAKATAHRAYWEARAEGR